MAGVLTKHGVGRIEKLIEVLKILTAGGPALLEKKLIPKYVPFVKMYRLKDNKAIEASDEWSSPGFKDAMSNMEANGGKQWNELKQAPAEAMEKAASRIKAVRPCLEKAGYPATAASPQAGSSSNSTAAAEASGVTTHGTLKRSYSLGPGNRLESATPKTPSAPPRPGKPAPLGEPAPPGKPVPSPATAKKA